MSSTFFSPRYSRPAGNKKLLPRRKKSEQQKSKPQKRTNENISSDSSDSDDFFTGNSDNSKIIQEDDDANLTPQEKRLKLAKIYLEEIKRKEEEQNDRKQFNESNISNRLKEELRQSLGRIRKKVANLVKVDSETKIHKWTTKECVTSMTLSKDCKTLYSGTKKGSITMYCVPTREKLKVASSKNVDSAFRCIQSLAISHDKKYLAVAQGKFINLRDGNSLDQLHTFRGHTSLVMGLAFRKDTYELFSCSKDRSVRHWSCDEKHYIDALFGHEGEVTAIDALHRERVITAGGYDHTIRLWKLTEESQLIFNTNSSSVDCLKLLDHENFVSGASDGSLQLWTCLKKKSLVDIKNAHGIDESNNTPNWIICVTTALNTDLIASGSYDGFIRLWRVSDDNRELLQICEIPISGFVNSLVFTENGDELIAAVSREHRLGRWWDQPKIKNSIHVIPLKK